MAAPFPVAASQTGEEWISVSDLMSGLMMVFLAIAVFFMLEQNAEKKELKEARAALVRIAQVHDLLRENLYEDLLEEFEQDLPRWGAELDRQTLSVRFKEPDVLFKRGDADLKPDFKVILDDFFPRYIGVLMRDRFREHVEEVRIEGHTSSEFDGGSPLNNYLHNMRLSQGRTRKVLKHVVRLPGVKEHWEGWLRERATANGLSSSHLVMKPSGAEDRRRSRRVEFRVRTDAERRLNDLLATIKRQAAGLGSMSEVPAR